MISILHIDTSGNNCTVAVSRDGVIASETTNSDVRNHAASINIMINEVLEKIGFSLKDLDAFSVIGGPGSYTGLRIGLATAKAYCYTLDKPLILVNKLSLLAEQAVFNKDQFAFYGSILPARDKEYFLTIYNMARECYIEPMHIEEKELIVLLQGLTDVFLTGSAGQSEQISQQTNVIFNENEHINLSSWGLYAFRLYNCNGFVNLASAEPYYLKQVYTHNSK